MKKRILILFLVIPLLLMGCSVKKDTLANVSEVKLESNQKLVAGKVTSITGNQIVLAIGTLPAQSAGANAPASGSRAQSSTASSGNSNVSSARSAAGSESGSTGSTPAGSGSGSSSANSYVSGNSYNGSKMSSSSYVTFTNSQGGSIQNGGFDSGNFQRPDSAGGPGSGNNAQAGNAGSPPSGFNASGSGAPFGNTNGNAGPAASGNAQSIANASAQASFIISASASSSITLTGETQTLIIPVGTKILMTSNGALTTTTFGRIQANDILELIVQTDSNGNQTIIGAQIME